MPSLVARLAGPLAVLLLLTGCSQQADPPAADSPRRALTTAIPSPEAPPAAAVPTKHLVGQVAGRLPGPRRKRLLRRVGPVVDGWLDAAFVGGTFPRRITGAWSAFTPGAARLARQDRGLTSLAGLSERIDGVRVTKRAVRYNVLAPGGRPAGVTARITLDLHTSGEVARKVSLRGRLALTPVRSQGRQEWRIFAFDLTRGRA